MSDNLTKSQRKKCMRRITSKNTLPEIAFRKLLWSFGFRGYRLHYPIDGRPDIVFLNKKLAIFVDGCFWHKCPFCFKKPLSNKEYWLKKILSNVKRDKEVVKNLKLNKWKVLRIWEHQLDIKENKNICIKIAGLVN